MEQTCLLAANKRRVRVVFDSLEAGTTAISLGEAAVFPLSISRI